MNEKIMNYRISIYDYHNNKQCDLKNKNISLAGEVYDVEWVKNINGFQSLKFKIPSHIRNSNGEKIDNPRLQFIDNKMLVYLYYGLTKGRRFDGLSLTFTELSNIVTASDTLPIDIVGSYINFDGTYLEIGSRDSDTQLTLVDETSDVNGVYVSSIVDDNKPRAYEKFVIDDISQEHKSNIVYYTVECPHYAYHALTQSGLGLTFIEENGIGIAYDLLEAILKDSDWTIEDGQVDVFTDINPESGQLEEKTRTLKAEDTNRYNLIQSLATLFAGYPVFNTWHKTVSFYQNPFVDRGVSFEYAKNLTSIKRDLASTQKIITKLWVEGGENVTDNNNNTLISDATNNSLKEPYILNFDFFTKRGLLSVEQLDALQLFTSTIGPINDDISAYLDQVSTLTSENIWLGAKIEGIEIAISAKEQSIVDNPTQAVSLQAQIDALQLLLDDPTTGYQTIYDSNEAALIILNSGLSSSQTTKEDSISVFESALSDFLLEGVWQQEMYTDENELYADALDVSAQMSAIQAAYTLSVVDLSALLGYEIEDLLIGDIVHVSDVSLNISNEEGNIKELTRILDNPTKNTVTISLRDSDFEDLFSQIISAASSVTFNKELFARGAFIDANGNLAPSMVESAFSTGIDEIGVGTDSEAKMSKEGFLIKSTYDEDVVTLLNANGLYRTKNFTAATPTWEPLAVNYDEFGVSMITTDAGGSYTPYSHYHTISTHTHGISTHTHAIDNHQHSIGVHSHGIGTHTHGMTHSHTDSGHTHTLNNHTHSIGSHTHGIGSHTHNVSGDTGAVEGASSGNTGTKSPGTSTVGLSALTKTMSTGSTTPGSTGASGVHSHSFDGHTHSIESHNHGVSLTTTTITYVYDLDFASETVSTKTQTIITGISVDYKSAMTSGSTSGGTDSAASHTHTSASHSHTATHSHSISNHSHTVDSHSHSIDVLAHTHTITGLTTDGSTGDTGESTGNTGSSNVASGSAAAVISEYAASTLGSTGDTADSITGDTGDNKTTLVAKNGGPITTASGGTTSTSSAV